MKFNNTKTAEEETLIDEMNTKKLGKFWQHE